MPNEIGLVVTVDAVLHLGRHSKEAA